MCNLHVQVAVALEDEEHKQAALIWACLFETALRWFAHAPM